MNYKISLVAVLAALISIGCAPTETIYGKDTPMDQRIKSARNVPDCNYDLVQGEEIIFNSYPLNPDIKTYQYFFFDHKIFNPNHPEVENYKNLHAKIKPELLDGEYSFSEKMHEVIVENCDILYIGNKKAKDWSNHLIGYTLKSKLDADQKKIAELKRLVGKNIWVGIGVEKHIRTRSNERKVLENYEKVTVVNILGEADLRDIMPVSGEILYLEVKRSNGDVGYYPFIEKSISLSYPFPKTWSVNVIKLIHERKIKIGMNNAQAIASWGKPKSINRTVTAQGTTEQWVYDISSYLYLTNNIVTAIQN